MLLTPLTRSLQFRGVESVQSIRGPWNWRHFLPRHEGLLECRNELVVPRTRLPQHPPVVTGVVHAALLLLELVRTVRRLTDAERLQPGTNVLPLDAEFFVALPCAGYGDVN